MGEEVKDGTAGDLSRLTELTGRKETFIKCIIKSINFCKAISSTGGIQKAGSVPQERL